MGRQTKYSVPVFVVNERMWQDDSPTYATKVMRIFPCRLRAVRLRRTARRPFSPFANREAERPHGVGIRWDGYSVALPGEQVKVDEQPGEIAHWNRAMYQVLLGYLREEKLSTQIKALKNNCLLC